MRFIGLFLLSLVLVSADEKKYTPQEYIDMYKDMAIAEMHRSGVPASITLAQGYLESGCGNSDLAKKANNHFGIKCHADWKGKGYYVEDDDYDEKGKLKKSCFRVYKSAEESFADHSEFLKTRQRYAFLFELRTTDYKGWSRGLKKAGYATNPKYADLLISIIERYELYQYDSQKEKKLLAKKRLTKKEVFNINEIPAIAYDGQMTIREIRDQYFTAEWQIFKYNDLSRKQKLKPGMVIYLKPKRNRNKIRPIYTVKEGDNMQYISQLTGMKLKKLYKINLMRKGEEPMVGEQLSLYNKRAIKPKTTQQPKPYKYFLIDPEGASFESGPEEKIADEKPAKKTGEKIVREDGIYHRVGSGETLSSISKIYSMNWKTLMDQNGLKTENLEIGQVLLIEPRQSAAIATETDDLPKSKKQEKGIKKEPNALPDGEPTAYSENQKNGFHTVQKGETLFSISRYYGMTVAEVMRINHMTEPSLKVGSEIRIKE